MHNYNKSLKRLFLILIGIFSLIHLNDGMQSNSSCAPMPQDKRQLVCLCGKQLQLKCVFNLDIRQVGVQSLDKTLKALKTNEVSIERLVDPNDYRDPNQIFQNLNKMRKNPSLHPNEMYLYFPNFIVFDSPYIRITFQRFIFVPSFAFVDQSKRRNTQINDLKEISSFVFEVSHVYDFGIDKYAFYGVQSESLLIEGPFNQITIHKDSFENSRIDELVIGCYCLDCESFIGDCVVKFGQKSMRRTFPNSHKDFLKTTGLKETKSSFKRMKFFGIKLGGETDLSTWNLDNLPNIFELEYLEISNQASLITSPNTQHLNEFKLSDSQKSLNKLTELHLKNNQIKHLSGKLLRIFVSLRTLNLVQNSMETLADDAFESNHNLEYLNLERNKIISLNKSILKNLVKLKYFNLKENQLVEIADGSFNQMKKLEFLDLTRNKLNKLTPGLFTGLNSLKELLLSYNPLKTISPDSFKSLAQNSPSLTRIDLISNFETDWFVFDESDICLLSPLACGTKVNIDMDQRCNCFVKYLNEIAGIHQRVDNLAGDKDNAWFKQPCVETRPEYSSSEQGFHRELKFDDYHIEGYIYDRDPALVQTNAIDNTRFLESSSNYQKCSKNILRACFSESQVNTNSCLYNKFLKERPNKIDGTEPNLNENSLLYHQANLQQDNILTKKFSGSNDNHTIYLGIGIFVVFIMASLSLAMTVYLISRQNRFAYYSTTQTSCPVDER